MISYDGMLESPAVEETGQAASERDRWLFCFVLGFDSTVPRPRLRLTHLHTNLAAGCAAWFLVNGKEKVHEGALSEPDSRAIGEPFHLVGPGSLSLHFGLTWKRTHQPAVTIGLFTVSQRSGLRRKCLQRPQRSAMCSDFGV